jgi:hypothetical protein
MVVQIMNAKRQKSRKPAGTVESRWPATNTMRFKHRGQIRLSQTQSKRSARQSRRRPGPLAEARLRVGSGAQ